MSGRRRLSARVALCSATLAVALALGPLAAPATPVAQAASATDPAVTLRDPQQDVDCQCRLPFGSVTLTATAAAPAGRSITAVEFAVSPAGESNWKTIDTVPQSTDATYTANFDTTDPALVPDMHGVFDLRATARDDHGGSSTQILHDRVIANAASVVILADPGAALNATITLRARFLAGNDPPQDMIFESRPAGTPSGSWTEIGGPGHGHGVREPIPPENGAVDPMTFDLAADTSTLGDGVYDFRVRASGHAQTDPTQSLVFVSAPQRDRLVDNTPPAASLSIPAPPLGGAVELAATASDSGSGVASVRFERAVAGSGTWVAIGTRVRPPYTQSLDTRLLRDGAYDLRVIATDRAGNAAPSGIASNVAVANAGRVAAGQLSIGNIIVPASNVQLLGAIAQSPQHETWALGTTSAPPASSGGARLPYTAQGNQIVLLRYTDGGGWEIADVLRQADDGTPFPQLPHAFVVGQMTDSGEAWIALGQKAKSGPAMVAMFHRAPGRPFVLDAAASAELGRLMPAGLKGDEQLRLKQSGDGTAFGLLLAPSQPVSLAAGYTTELRYLDLAGGRWSQASATLARLPFSPPRPGNLALTLADPTGPGEGWGALSITTAPGTTTTLRGVPFALASFRGGTWDWKTTKLDALDLTDGFAETPRVGVAPNALVADSGGVWIGASVGGTGNVIARFDTAADAVTQSWCAALAKSVGCGPPIDADHPAAVPDRVFDTPEGRVALALGRNGDNFLHVYAHGDWSVVAAPGFGRTPGVAPPLFTAPGEGWLPGANALGHVSSTPSPSPLATWPQSNRSPLTSVALAPSDGSAGVDASGALAVGLDGTALRYEASAGWLVVPTPPRARRAVLRGVAFSSPERAFAVGSSGIILRWDGSSWTEDPQSTTAARSELTAVAFDASSGQGWAVGRYGTILHFDGSSWSPEAPPAGDEAASLSSVAVAGSEVFAVAGGHLIVRDASGRWRPASNLPAGLPGGDLRLVAGLPDGGLVAAGRSALIVRQGPSGAFEPSEQPIEGTAVALAAFRAGGRVRAFVSVAPTGPTDFFGFPPGDGDLLRQSDAGFEDLSHAQFAGRSSASVPGDGVVKSDPVLAVATDPTGSAAWAVGGYAGTATASGLGTENILPLRAPGWRTSQIWRYDTAGSRQSPALEQTTVTVAAKPRTVSFAFFSGAECRVECAATRDAQPDVNLRAATTQMATFAQQPGGPGFAVVGGNARGPSIFEPRQAGNGAFDFANLPDLVSPLGGLPLFAAFGAHDAVPGRANPAQPWADAFAGAPAPFGSAPPAPGISPAGTGSATGAVSRYYAFDAGQNDGRLRVIVLDSSKGSLEDSAPGQTAWLKDRLAEAAAGGLAVVVVASSDQLGDAGDGLSVESLLYDAGVLALFTGSHLNLGSHLNTVRGFPQDVAPGGRQMLEYTGGSLSYQEAANNGVVWYLVSVDTGARAVSVKAIPVVGSLALKPLIGLSAARSSTLAFEAVGRRPVGTLATTVNNDGFPGIDNYVSIPAGSCGTTVEGRTCVKPAYTFASRDPTIGDFVVPSGAGSRFPKLDGAGRAIVSSTSGLFCAFNTGTTVVSVTSGLLKASLPVTVQAGGIGRPCGTVFRRGVGPVTVVPAPARPARQTAPAPGVNVPPTAPPPAAAVPFKLPNIAAPLPAPQPAPAPQAQPPAPASAPLQPQPPPPVVAPLPPLVALAPIPAPAQPPVPPSGSATAPSQAQAQAAARRREKAHKHASQSAFTVRPAGVGGEDWFLGAAGVAGVLAMVLAAGAIHAGPGSRDAVLAFSERGRPR